MSFTAMHAGLQPYPEQQVLSSNYLQWTDAGGVGPTPDNFADFAQQYLPELYEQEVERFGNRTISGFLRMVGAEMPMTSDQVIWSEQNRLHIAYTDVSEAGGVFTVNSTADDLAIRVNNTIVVYDPVSGVTLKGIVDAIAPTGGLAANEFNAICYTTGAGAWGALAGAAGLRLFVYGSDFQKGTNGMAGAVEPVMTQFNNKPIIIKDQYEVNGSDTAQIGWVEVATEDGATGFLWYIKAESETRLRYEDYLEMVCVEGEVAANAASVAAGLSGGGRYVCCIRSQR